MLGLHLDRTRAALLAAGCALEDVVRVPVAVVVRTPSGERCTLQRLDDGGYAVLPGLLRYASLAEAVSAACCDDATAVL